MEWDLEDMVVVMGKLNNIQFNNDFVYILYSGWGGNDTTIINN